MAFRIISSRYRCQLLRWYNGCRYKRVRRQQQKCLKPMRPDWKPGIMDAQRYVVLVDLVAVGKRWKISVSCLRCTNPTVRVLLLSVKPVSHP